MRVAQQAGLEDVGGLGRADAVADVVAGGQDDQVPEALDGPLRLPVRAQPVAEAAAVQAPARGVGHAQQGQRRASQRQPLAAAEVREAQHRPGQVQRRGQRTGQRGDRPRHARRRVEHRHAQPRLKLDVVPEPQPLDQGDVGRAAAQEDVLAVVELRAAAGVGEGERLAADEGAPLDEGGGQPRLGQVERAGQARQSTPHDDGAPAQRGRRLGFAPPIQSRNRRRMRPSLEGLTRAL